MRYVVLSFVLFVSFSAFALASSPDLYYGTEFQASRQDKNTDSDHLKSLLFTILSGGHIKRVGAPDEIVPSCSGLTSPEQPEVKCVQHTSLGYESARRVMFGQIYLRQKSDGTYFVKDVYCEKEFSDADFGGETTFGPNLLPLSGNIINTEHTWPQSRFTGRFPRETQKSDLHHLFPTDSQMNSKRSALRFGYVTESIEPLKCPQNKLGRQTEGDFIFEVPDSQKGNTARAIFYFATRYQMRISPPEEQALREWNKKDPVDQEEIDRNNMIEEAQGNRNPYVDYPELIDQLGPF